MVFQFRAATSGDVTSPTTSIVVTKPTGVANGDGLVAVIYHQNSGGTPTVTPPTGWTLVGSATGDPATTFRMLVYKKSASGEGASWTWTLSSAQIAEWACHAYEGAHTDVVEASAITATGETGATQTADAVTTLTAGAIVAAFLGYTDNSTSVTSAPPTGMTERTDRRAFLQMGITSADVAQPTAGSSGTKAFTLTMDFSVARAVTATLAIKGASTTHTAAAALSAAVTLTPKAGLLFTPGASLAAAATLSPLATGEVLAASVLPSTGTLTADGNLGVLLAASAFVGSATLAALAAPLVKTAAAALAASALLTASATRIGPIKTVSLGAGFTSSSRQHGGVAY